LAGKAELSKERTKFKKSFKGTVQLLIEKLTGKVNYAKFKFSKLDVQLTF
jgi:hypothetical protein